MGILDPSAKTDVDIDLSVFRIGGALVVDLEVGSKGTRASQFIGRHRPDELPDLGDDLLDGSSAGGEDGVSACGNMSDGKVGGLSFGDGGGKTEQIGIVTGVIGLVVGVNGDEVDSDLVRYLCDATGLKKGLPDAADLAIAGHLLRVIGAGRNADDV